MKVMQSLCLVFVLIHLVHSNRSIEPAGGSGSSVDHLTIGTLQYPPFVERNEINDSVVYTGMVIDLIDRLSAELGFTYDLVEPRDRAYGMLTNNGSWDGGIAMLIAQEIDMFAGALTITYDRSRVVDFTIPFHFDSVGVILKSSRPSIDLLQWARPLEGTVWIAIIGSCAFGALYLRLLHAKFVRLTTRTATTGFERLGTCAWYMISGLVNQGSELHPTTLSAMVFLGFWWLFCVAMIAVYTGVLVAILTIDKSIIPIKNFNDLADVVESDSYRLCMVRSTSIHAEIEAATDVDSSFVRLRNWLRAHPEYIVDTDDECFRMLTDEKTIAVIGDATALESIRQRTGPPNESLIVVNDHVHPSYLALAFRKGSKYVRSASESIVRIRETGLLDAWRANHSSKYARSTTTNSDEPPSVQSETQALTLREIAGLLICTIIGISISFLGFGFERSIKTKLALKLKARIMQSPPNQGRGDSPPQQQHELDVATTSLSSVAISQTTTTIWTEPEWSGRISPIYKKRFGIRAYYMYLPPPEED